MILWRRSKVLYCAGRHKILLLSSTCARRRPDLRLAAGRCTIVNRLSAQARAWCSMNSAPPWQNQPDSWNRGSDCIVRTKPSPWRGVPFDATKEMIVSGPNLLARGLSARSDPAGCKCLGAGKDYVIRIYKVPDFVSGPVNLDLTQTRHAVRFAECLECPCCRRLPHAAGWCSLTALLLLPGSTHKRPPPSLHVNQSGRCT